MSVLEIIRWPDARLSMRCDPVPEITADIHRLAADMLETMYAAPGRGLAAPQVGELARVFVMDAGWKEDRRAPEVFINPQVTGHGDGQSTQPEGCLSIPGVAAVVTRPETVRLRWTDLAGETREREFAGFEAVCVQHEVDHLDGIVTLDRLEAEERARVLKAYSAVLA